MSLAIITGSSGLVGSETAIFLHGKGLEIVGIDNNLRKQFFGEESCTDWRAQELKKTLRNFTHYSVDIRERDTINAIFEKYGSRISLVVHTASQPSHDLAAKDPFLDFSVNAAGTLVLLEAARRHCPDCVFIFTSTNKVYGDAPNHLPLVEQETRWEIDSSHAYYKHGIDEQMSLDQSMHSLFGVSKASADLLTQEYGRYYGLKTGIFKSNATTLFPGTSASSPTVAAH
jgi:CDP-paratose 2-epimerase